MSSGMDFWTTATDKTQNIRVYCFFFLISPLLLHLLALFPLMPPLHLSVPKECQWDRIPLQPPCCYHWRKKAAAYTTIKLSFMKIRQLARVMFTQFIIRTETLSRLPTTLYNAHYRITHTTQHTNVTEHTTHKTLTANGHAQWRVESLLSAALRLLNKYKQSKWNKSIYHSFTQRWIKAIGELNFALIFFPHPGIQVRPCQGVWWRETELFIQQEQSFTTEEPPSSLT
jgi:hypothetical protein